MPLNSGAKPAKAYLDFEVELKKREEKFYSTFNAKREEQSKRLRAKATEYLIAVLEVEKLPNEEFYSFVQADDATQRFHSDKMISITDAYRTLKTLEKPE